MLRTLHTYFSSSISKHPERFQVQAARDRAQLNPRSEIASKQTRGETRPWRMEAGARYKDGGTLDFRLFRRKLFPPIMNTPWLLSPVDVEVRNETTLFDFSSGELRLTR